MLLLSGCLGNPHSLLLLQTELSMLNLHRRVGVQLAVVIANLVSSLLLTATTYDGLLRTVLLLLSNSSALVDSTAHHSFLRLRLMVMHSHR